MGLINTSSNRIFLGINKGKITRKNGEEIERFDAIEGVLSAINVRSVDIKGEPTQFLDLIIEDGGETYALSTQLNGGVSRSILLSLASVQNFVGARVAINPYLSKDGEHTNVAVRVNGQKVSWVVSVDKLPAVKKVTVGTKTVIDDTDRAAYFNQLVAEIQQRLKAAAATPQAASATDDGDMPDFSDEDSFFADGAEHI